MKAEFFYRCISRSYTLSLFTTGGLLPGSSVKWSLVDNVKKIITEEKKPFGSKWQHQLSKIILLKTHKIRSVFQNQQPTHKNVGARSLHTELYAKLCVTKFYR
jgi:hypothetical protein